MNDERLTQASEPRIHRSSAIVHRLLSALWFGSAVFLLLSAAAAFAAAGNPTIAANVVGAMLSRWHYIALLAPVLLLLMEWRRARGRVMALLFAAILLAAVQVLADVRIRQIRLDSPVPISSLSRSDPVRRQFGMLHGASSLLLIAQALVAGVFLALKHE
jgi:hypothetical protein